MEALVPGDARVIAVFERSCYVETPAGLACLGAVGNGPLNAHCTSLPAGLGVGDSLYLNLAQATVWRARTAPAWDPGRVARSLTRLRSAACGQLPAEGFASLLDPQCTHPPAVAALERWLADQQGVPDGAAGLIGLGPGLTPSGDDLIGGALCALHAARRTGVAARLAAWALPLAKAATNRISQAHLACAAQGESGEAVNDAIVALLEGNLPNLARVDAVGHTSGWDALAGAVLAMERLSQRESVPVPIHQLPGQPLQLKTLAD